jgi:hypothetical protein
MANTAWPPVSAFLFGKSALLGNSFSDIGIYVLTIEFPAIDGSFTILGTPGCSVDSYLFSEL